VNPSINERIDETARDGKQMANKKYVTEVFRIGNLFIVKSVHVKELKRRPEDHKREHHHKAHFEHSLFRPAHFGIALLDRLAWCFVTTQHQPYTSIAKGQYEQWYKVLNHQQKDIVNLS